MSEEETRNIAITYLKKVRVADKSEVYPIALSGGQKQRVAIARALVLKPQILLVDEPTRALDPEIVKEVLNCLKELASTGITMIIVSHEINFATEISDRILFMD